MTKRTLRIAVSLFLMVALLALFLWNVNFKEVGQALESANPWWLLLAGFLALLSYWLRAVRIILLLRPVGRVRHSTANLSTAVGYAAMSLLPARMGDLVRPVIISRRDALPLSAALASILTERLFDMWTIIVGFLLFSLAPPTMDLSSEALRILDMLELTGWILGAGVVVPNVLRWYWWRMNGWGYAAGTLAGLRKTVEVGKPVTVFLRKRPGDARFKVDYPSGTVDLTPVLGEDGFYLNAPPSPDPGFIFFHPLPAAGFDGYLTAVNPPPAESELSFLEADEIASAVGVPPAFHVGDPGRLAEVRTRLKSGVPIGGWFFLLALLVLAAESILANDVAARIMAGRKAEASTLGPLSRKAIMSLRRRRKRKKEAV